MSKISMTVDQALQEAVSHHRACRLQEAERLYRAILQAQPKHPDANHNLGVLAIGVGQATSALPFFKVALEANPQNRQFWLSYIDALIRAGQTDNARQLIAIARSRGFQGEALTKFEAQLPPPAKKADSSPLAPTVGTNYGTDPLAQAIAAHETGRYAEAIDWLDYWLTKHPADAAALALLTHDLLLNKQNDRAAAVIQQAIQIAPDSPHVQRSHARLLLKCQRAEAALQAAQAAQRADPENPESWLVLAATLGANQRDAEALPLVNRALQVRPDYAEAFASRALLKLRAKDPSGALADAEQALALKPHLTQIWALTAHLRYLASNLPSAIEAMQKALELDPDNVVYMVDLGEFLRQDKQFEAALAILEKATTAEPGKYGAWVNYGAALQAADRIEEARAAYHKALAIQPQSAEIASNLGKLAAGEGNFEEALSYFDQALAVNPDNAVILGNRAAALTSIGLFSDAESNYREASRLSPASGEYTWNAELLLPVIIASEDEIVHWRRRYLQGIDVIMDMPNTLGVKTNQVVTQSFYLAYHGADDRPLMEALCRLFRTKSPPLNFTAPHISVWKPPVGRRIRIGMLSQFLVMSHTIGKLFQGFLHLLDRTRFEVVVLHAPKVKRDALSAELDKLADRMLALPASLAAQQQMVAELELDVLFYPDIGMSPATYFLAYARLAPVQAVSWGHPDTTGLDTLDYFVSGDSIEPDNGETHYSERLIRMNRLPCFYRPLVAPTQIPVRAALGLPEEGTLYGCPQALFKFHPEFDAVLADIAGGDPAGHIVVIEGKFATWTRLLRERWATSVPMLNERVVFLPRQPMDRFMALMAHFDVLLDPIHFGCGNTLYEALVYGKPIVTWPGRFARGRFVAGVYQQMGIADAPIAQRVEDYAPLALALGSDAARRARLREALLQGAKELFVDIRAVREFEAFLEAAVAAAGRGAKLPAGWRPPMNSCAGTSQTTKVGAVGTAQL